MVLRFRVRRLHPALFVCDCTLHPTLFVLFLELPYNPFCRAILVLPHVPIPLDLLIPPDYLPCLLHVALRLGLEAEREVLPLRCAGIVVTVEVEGGKLVGGSGAEVEDVELVYAVGDGVVDGHGWRVKEGEMGKGGGR